MKEFIEKLIGRLEEEILTCQSAYTESIIGMCGKSAENYISEMHAFEKTKKIVNQLAEEYINCSTDTSTNTSSGWIPCSERLPEPIDDMLQCVIVTDENDWQGMAYYHPQKGWVFAECHNSDRKIDWTEIIAWQPLPPAYVPEEGKE